MLAYRRLQTIIGREISGDELLVVAAVFKKSVDFFCKEESTEPWKVEPEPVACQFEIEDTKLIEKIFDKSNELDISPDGLVSHIVKEYMDRQCHEVACNEQIHT